MRTNGTGGIRAGGGIGADIRATAKCGCGGDRFHIAGFRDDTWQAWCCGCGEAWAPPGWGEAQDVNGNAAVEGTGHVAADVVQPPA